MNKAIKERKRGHKFNEIWQLPTSSGQNEKEILLINQVQVINFRDNTPLYIVKESTKKKKPKTLKLDQK